MSDANLLLDPLPTGWRNCAFGDICERVNESHQPVAGGKTPYLGLEHLAQGLPAIVGRGTEDEVRSSKTAFRAGDILFGKLRPYLRKAARPDFDGVCSTDILVFRVKDCCDSHFLRYLVHCDPFVDYAKSTTTGVQHPRTSWPSLKTFKLSFPPLSEQKKIAHILSTVQRAIEEQDRIIQTTTKLKKALMQKLFTEGLRGEPQKETEIGLVPESWEVVPLGEVVKLKSGGTPSRTNPEFWEGGLIPWVKTGEVDYCEIHDTEEKITAAGLAGSSATIFPTGTLLMAMYGQGITRGKVAILGVEAATNQACVAFFPQAGIRTKFLYYFFEYHYERIRNLGHGANQKNLSAEILKGMQVAFPGEHAKQDVIIDSLEALDRKLLIHRRTWGVQSDLFRTMLHELMTAKIRVNNCDLLK